MPPVTGRLSRIDWRPRVLRSTGSVTEGIYGLILAVSVIAVSREYESSNAGVIAVTVLVTGVVFWLAHVYARILSRSMAGDRWPTRAETREVLRHDWPLVEVTLPLVAVLLLGVLDLIGDTTAVLFAVLAAPAGARDVGGVRGAVVGRRHRDDAPVGDGRGRARGRGRAAEGARPLSDPARAR